MYEDSLKELMRQAEAANAPYEDARRRLEESVGPLMKIAEEQEGFRKSLETSVASIIGPARSSRWPRRWPRFSSARRCRTGSSPR